MKEPKDYTEEELYALQDEYNHLVRVEYRQIMKEIEEARSQGVKTLDSPFNPLRIRRMKAESRLKEIEKVFSTLSGRFF